MNEPPTSDTTTQNTDALSPDHSCPTVPQINKWPKQADIPVAPMARRAPIPWTAPRRLDPPTTRGHRLPRKKKEIPLLAPHEA